MNNMSIAKNIRLTAVLKDEPAVKTAEVLLSFFANDSTHIEMADFRKFRVTQNLIHALSEQDFFVKEEVNPVLSSPALQLVIQLHDLIQSDDLTPVEQLLETKRLLDNFFD